MTAACSEASLAAGEKLSATAVTAERWLLVEVPGAWPRDVDADGVLAGRARSAVADWLAEPSAARLQLVRRPGRTGRRPLAFAIRAEESRREVRRIELDRLDDLADVDLHDAGARVDSALVLVCGHGSRDRCCASRGTAVYRALESQLGEEELWISSHLGGHRFAANVLVLPVGLQLGRVDEEDARDAVARALAGRIELERYRGRTCYAREVQAAEHAVRTASGLDGVDDLRLDAVQGAHVRLLARDGTHWQAEVEQVPGPAVPASCGEEPSRQSTFTARVV
jgi:hypothetical protein